MARVRKGWLITAAVVLSITVTVVLLVEFEIIPGGGGFRGPEVREIQSVTLRIHLTGLVVCQKASWDGSFRGWLEPEMSEKDVSAHMSFGNRIPSLFRECRRLLSEVSTGTYEDVPRLGSEGWREEFELDIVADGMNYHYCLKPKGSGGAPSPKLLDRVIADYQGWTAW